LEINSKDLNFIPLNRVDRLLGILTILQSKKFVTAEQLATRFEISIRTVYRDIRALDEIGVPVTFEPNKGYNIVQGYFLPPVTFTTEEANALALMGAIAHRFTDNSIQKHYETALQKVTSVLKTPQKDSLHNFTEQIKTFKPDLLQNDFAYLSEIQNSISSKTTLRLDYQNFNSELSIREIEPIGLLFYGMNWHVIAWCWNRNEYRDFRASRIMKLYPTHTHFKKTDHITLNDYLAQISMHQLE
jgi:predicted DNA-binding transcriptional regulator YafY